MNLSSKFKVQSSKLKYSPIIGVEVHVELKTKSKMFCGCDASHFRIPPNTHTCPVCLGLPGALPVPNATAIDWTIMIGLALDCTANDTSYFERKNYFYPDLPKGYQISQYEKPFCRTGKLAILLPGSSDNRSTIGILKTIRVNRVHLEEDTGKLQHKTIDRKDWTLIDFNRSGVPLVEIVSEPDMSSAAEVVVYLKKLQQIIRYLGVSDCDMEKGSMRLEPTVNLAIETNSKTVYTPLAELKNINSFRFAREAIEFEIRRQLTRFQKEGITKSNHPKETRGYDEDKQATVPQREKEEAHDYRYFPEPDIPPFTGLKAKSLKLKARMPELPEIKKARFMKQYGLTEGQTTALTSDIKQAVFFERCVLWAKKNGLSYSQLANRLVNRPGDYAHIKPEAVVAQILEEKENRITDSDQLTTMANKIVHEFPKQLSLYKAGKTNLINFFVGQLMRATNGKADAQTARKVWEKLLNLPNSAK